MATRPTAYEEMSKFWTKNKALGRPISPHLSIYKMHLTMLVSITNRITAVILQGGLVVGSLTLMVLPGTYSHYLGLLKDMKFGSALIGTAKFLLSLVFAYHFVAGGRHLLWDMGFGFSKPMTYKGSWVVLGLTGAFTAFLMLGVRPSAM